MAVCSPLAKCIVIVSWSLALLGMLSTAMTIFIDKHVALDFVLILASSIVAIAMIALFIYYLF